MDSRPSPTPGPAAASRRFRPFECASVNGQIDPDLPFIIPAADGRVVWEADIRT
jgi:hypothetical protein